MDAMGTMNSRIKKKELHNKWGQTDLEHLALDLYDCFHGHPTGERLGWTAYEKYNDAVVEEFRRAARNILISWDRRIGAAYYYED
jgi:hypothetical protein